MLDRQLPGSDAEDVRGFEWFFLNRMFRSEAVTLPVSFEPVDCVEYSPDGRTLAVYSGDGVIRFIHGDDGSVLGTIEQPDEWIESMAVAPDGSWLATGGRNGSIGIWDVATRTEHQIRDIAFSHDGRTLASCDKNGNVRLWRVPSTEGIHSTTLAITPDGNRLAVPGDGGTSIWDVQTGELLRTPTTATSPADWPPAQSGYSTSHGRNVRIPTRHSATHIPLSAVSK